MTTETTALPSSEVAPAVEKKGVSPLQVAAWFGVGIAVAAVGIVVGRELRSRYKFNQRTPYDFYAASGDYASGEYGVGI